MRGPISTHALLRNALRSASAHDARGIVALEYLLVVIAAMLAGGASLLAIGRTLYTSYIYQLFAVYYNGP